MEEYDIQTVEDIQDALKDQLGGPIKEMMEAEMEDHLGYEKSECSDSDDYRNGYKPKRVNSSYGTLEIEVPQDRKSTFEPKVVRKRQKDISDIDQKIISMYAKGMTTRQISAYFRSFQSTVFSLWLFHLPDGSGIFSPFPSRSYTLRLLGRHFPFSSIARMVSRIWAWRFPSPLSWMAKSAIMPLKQKTPGSSHG